MIAVATARGSGTFGAVVDRPGAFWIGIGVGIAFARSWVDLLFAFLFARGDARSAGLRRRRRGQANSYYRTLQDLAKGVGRRVARLGLNEPIAGGVQFFTSCRCRERPQKRNIRTLLPQLVPGSVMRNPGRSRSDIARDALRRQLAVLQFEEARRQVLPFAEARGYLTDEDVFRDIS